MKKYQILEHKADLKIKVFGKTKEELFENALIGMLEGARYEGEGKEAKREIKISSPNLPSLLVDFLNEVLYLVETEKEVYQKVSFKKFSQRKIEATLIGKKLKRMGVHIKAVTYHDLDIHQKPSRAKRGERKDKIKPHRPKDGIWQATILFDI